MGRTGLLLVGFGGPDSLDAVEPFMRNLMGREPSAELLERVRIRYLAIGGASPLPTIASEIAVRLADKLEQLGSPMPVAVGMAYWRPYIGEAVDRLAAQGCDRIITVSLSPFESEVAQQTYRDQMSTATEKHGIEVVEAPLIGTMPEYCSYYAGATAAALEDLQPNQGAIIAFCAHSLPLSDLSDDDPYIRGVRKVASCVAEELGLEEAVEDAGDPMFDAFRAWGSSQLPRAWYLVYQSKGNKPGEWLGPDIEQLIDACIESKVPAIVTVPIGFMTDHMETLYDLDIVAAGKALEGDVEFVRAPAPNDHDVMVDAIAGAVSAL